MFIFITVETDPTCYPVTMPIVDANLYSKQETAMRAAKHHLAHRVKVDGGQDETPQWSPNRQRVAFIDKWGNAINLSVRIHELKDAQ